MKKMLAVLVPALALFLAPVKASATTVDDCQFDISVLSAQTAAAAYLRGDQGLKLESQLLHQLAHASKELGLNDFAQALVQMDSYSIDVSKGVASGKIDSASALDLQLGANTVVVCINAIGK